MSMKYALQYKYRSMSLTPSIEKPQILPQQFKQLQKIGTGLSSEVYRSTYSKQNEDVCIKLINKQFYASKIGEELIKNQILILKSIQHRNIVKFFKDDFYGDRRFIVMEYCKGGDLQKQLNIKKTLKELQALKIFRQILEGFQYLCKMNILHRDLKPSNIMFHNGIAKIGDFGFSVNINNQSLMKKNVGSPLYMAPQVLENLDFSEKSQIFSLGIILYEMLAGKTPWSAQNQKDLLSKIKTEKLQKIYSIHTKTSQLLSKCLNYNKNARPTIQQVLQQVNTIINQYQNKKVKKIELNDIKKQGLFDITNHNKHNKGKSYSNYEKAVNKTTIGDLITPQNKKYLAIQTQICVKNINKENNKPKKQDHQQFTQIISKINQIHPQKLSFLPASLILKLQYILSKYLQILSSENKQTSKLHKDIQHDQLMKDVSNSHTQKELCQAIANFIRRILRLTKSYPVSKSILESIDNLYQHVIKSI